MLFQSNLELMKYKKHMLNCFTTLSLSFIDLNLKNLDLLFTVIMPCQVPLKLAITMAILSLFLVTCFAFCIAVQSRIFLNHDPSLVPTSLRPSILTIMICWRNWYVSPSNTCPRYEIFLKLIFHVLHSFFLKLPGLLAWPSKVFVTFVYIISKTSSLFTTAALIVSVPDQK